MDGRTHLATCGLELLMAEIVEDDGADAEDAEHEDEENASHGCVKSERVNFPIGCCPDSSNIQTKYPNPFNCPQKAN